MESSAKVTNRAKPVMAVPSSMNHLPLDRIENWRNFHPIIAGRFRPSGVENLMRLYGKNYISNRNNMMQQSKDPSPGFSGHAPETEDADTMAEEHRKMIAEWLITWLKEGDARLAMR